MPSTNKVMMCIEMYLKYLKKKKITIIIIYEKVSCLSKVCKVMSIMFVQQDQNANHQRS